MIQLSAVGHIVRIIWCWNHILAWLRRSDVWSCLYNTFTDVTRSYSTVQQTSVIILYTLHMIHFSAIPHWKHQWRDKIAVLILLCRHFGYSCQELRYRQMKCLLQFVKKQLLCTLPCTMYSNLIPWRCSAMVKMVKSTFLFKCLK